MADPAGSASPAEVRRLWALGACGIGLCAAVVAFNLLYLQVPRGWTPIHGFAPDVGAAYARWLSPADGTLTPRAFARLSVALQVAMWGAFLGAVYLASKLRGTAAGAGAVKLVAIVAAAAAAALMLTPPALSPDLYHYALFGRMIITRGLNPYVTAGNALGDDPLFPLASWPDFPTHYGPVFTGLSVVAAFIGAGHPIATALAFKGLAIGGGALAAWAAAGIARQAGRDGLLPLLLVAWNPLALIETAGSGHNEMVMVGLALAGVLLFRRGRIVFGFALVLASIHVKWVSAALAGLLVLAHLRETDGARARARALAGLAALAVAITVALYAPFWTGFSSVTATRRLMLEAARSDASKAGAIAPVNVVLFAAVAAIAVAVVARRGRRVELELAALVSFAFVVFMFPWVFPWYLLPAAALLAPAQPGRLHASLTVIVTAASMFLMAFWAVLVPR